MVTSVTINSRRKKTQVQCAKNNKKNDAILDTEIETN